jgi:hypothetical protein
MRSIIAILSSSLSRKPVGLAPGLADFSITQNKAKKRGVEASPYLFPTPSPGFSEGINEDKQPVSPKIRPDFKAVLSSAGVCDRGQAIATRNENGAAL